jgi:hypothetical protein
MWMMTLWERLCIEAGAGHASVSYECVVDHLPVSPVVQCWQVTYAKSAMVDHLL